jgi:hypothetical protein
MTSLSEAAAPKTSAAKRNQSSMETVADVTAPVWKKPASRAGKLGQKKA